MEKCLKCGRELPTGAKICPTCGNPVSFFEEKMRPASYPAMPPAAISPGMPAYPAPRKHPRGRTILILTAVVLSVLLIASLVFAIMLGTAPAKLAVSPGTIDYGTLQVGSQGNQILTLTNSGRQDLNWSATKETAASWLTLEPGQGLLTPGGSQTISVRADTTHLTAGGYSASIRFSSNGGEASVSVVLAVASGPAASGGPVVSNIEPKTGPAAGGTTVTIQGSNFTGANHVLFGSTAVDHFTVNSDTQITAVSPAGSGMVHVTVVTSAGTSATSSADQFTYQPPPTTAPTTAPTPSVVVPRITGIVPTSGPLAGGTIVIIRGWGFTGVSKVLFGTTSSYFTVNSNTSMNVVSPAGSGTVHIRIITSAGTTAISTADQFTYLPQPTITNISPVSGPTWGGTTVTITGSGLAQTSKVLFGDTPASGVTVISNTRITTLSPAGGGTVHVRVITPGGTTATSTADQFTYLAQPTITGLSPTAGPAAGKTTVTITGSGLAQTSKVLFGDTPASGVTVIDNTQITAVSPAGSGTVHISVTTPAGTTVAKSVDLFTYQPEPPQITSVKPSVGPASGGTQVVIEGSGFTGASKVLFGPTEASSISVSSDTKITAISPVGSGKVHISVTAPGGITAASDNDLFTYQAVQPPPQITSIDPNSGPTWGDTTVTIHGSGFTGVTSVLFGSTPASNISIKSDGLITADSPVGSGTVHVFVTTHVGTTAASANDLFTYQTKLPRIESITPKSGPIG